MISSARSLIFFEGLLIGKADERMHNKSSLPFATCKTISDVDVSLQLFLYIVEIEIMALVECMSMIVLLTVLQPRGVDKLGCFIEDLKPNYKWINYMLS